MQKSPLRILLAGSSHTRLMFPAVKMFLKDRAVVTKLPRDAGRSDEILGWMAEWPLEEQDVIHLYSGHRDLAFGPDGAPYVGPDRFRANLERILSEMLRRSSARIVVSNIPPVSEGFLRADPERNRRIGLYNGIIADVARRLGLPCHDFWSFISSREGEEEKYLDGLHFTKDVYRAFGKELAEYLVSRAGKTAP